jgi:hypothetical protein
MQCNDGAGDTISPETLARCGPCSTRPPKLLGINDFETSRGNTPTTLFQDLAVAVSVYAALSSRHLISPHAASSHRVPTGARQALFSL